MIRFCILSIFFLILSLSAYNQKVALVLSGGGAKGAAHIGVLKALEENNIPIHSVAGTSMGAIIGGLYACGYNPQEIENLISSKEFERWAAGIADPAFTYHHKKDRNDASWINLPFNYGEKLKLPFNIISPFEMDYTFMEIFAGPSAAAGYDFDSLYLPFRCVAADIDSNKAQILSSGHLGESIRASMTFPFYFKPIRIGDKLLFDGGMYNNFPADIAEKDFQPDVIIGSKAAGNYDPPDENDIISQLQNMLMANTDYTVLPKKGVVIEPNMGPANVVDFSRSQEFIDSGYYATINKMHLIKDLVYERISKEQRQRDRLRFFNKKPPIIVDSIQIAGVSELKANYFQKVLKRSVRFLTISELKEKYFKLVADPNVEYIYPRLNYNKRTGFFDLFLDIEESNNLSLQFGGNISTGSMNEAFIGAQYRVLRKNAYRVTVNTYFGRFYDSFHISGRSDIPSAIPYFVRAEYTFANRDYYKINTYFFEDEEPSFIIHNESFFNFDIGIPIGNKDFTGIGLSLGRNVYEYYPTNNFSKNDTTNLTTFRINSPYFFYEFNTHDDKLYPLRGHSIRSVFWYVNGDEEFVPGTSPKGGYEYKEDHSYYLIRIKSDNYINLNPSLKAGIYGEMAISNKRLFENYTSSVLSAHAFTPIPESKTLYLSNYRANSYFAFGLKGVILLNKRAHIRLEGYVFQAAQEILNNPYNNSPYYGERFAKQSYIGSAVMVYQTPLGPLSVSLNGYDRGPETWSFLVNFGYLIFNRSIFE